MYLRQKDLIMTNAMEMISKTLFYRSLLHDNNHAVLPIIEYTQKKCVAMSKSAINEGKMQNKISLKGTFKQYV